ncbi:ester cyclase [Streptomyces halobius]|uniref:Ester cyclase n=1 Tax=Streptomyces halobius TaxID=2879846 RepID=A0ABY4MEG3_9ACTN|nr:ester cyclase [Streptomyces halobius]UQA94741.1 ester cyclase [Streptomyces halobius]
MRTDSRLAPTGKKCVTTGTTVFRFRDGKIQEARRHYDTSRLTQQLGAPG